MKIFNYIFTIAILFFVNNYTENCIALQDYRIVKNLEICSCMPDIFRHKITSCDTIITRECFIPNRLYVIKDRKMPEQKIEDSTAYITIYIHYESGMDSVKFYNYKFFTWNNQFYRIDDTLYNALLEWYIPYEQYKIHIDNYNNEKNKSSTK